MREQLVAKSGEIFTLQFVSICQRCQRAGIGCDHGLDVAQVFESSAMRDLGQHVSNACAAECAKLHECIKEMVFSGLGALEAGAAEVAHGACVYQAPIEDA